MADTRRKSTERTERTERRRKMTVSSTYRCKQCGIAGHHETQCNRFEVCGKCLARHNPRSRCVRRTRTNRDDRTCYKCNKTGHISRDCRSKSCYRCKQFGHIANDCTLPCSRCNMSGHQPRNCPSSKKKCTTCKGFGHMFYDCTNSSCGKCDCEGHSSFRCPKTFCTQCRSTGHHVKICPRECSTCGADHKGINCPVNHYVRRS